MREPDDAKVSCPVLRGAGRGDAPMPTQQLWSPKRSRRVLLNRFGENTAAEFKKEYDDLYFGAPRPPRNTPN